MKLEIQSIASMVSSFRSPFTEKIVWLLLLLFFRKSCGSFFIDIIEKLGEYAIWYVLSSDEEVDGPIEQIYLSFCELLQEYIHDSIDFITKAAEHIYALAAFQNQPMLDCMLFPEFARKTELALTLPIGLFTKNQSPISL